MKITIKNNLPSSELTFELEGEWENLKPQLEQISSYLKTLGGSTAIPKKVAKKTSTTTSAKAPTAKKSALSFQPVNLPELLTKDDIEKLRNYFKEKSPASHIEICCVFTLWLRDNKQLPQVGVDEMWTLYRAIGEKPPKYLIQVFRDGKSKKGYFALDATTNKYYITNLGEIFVEYDLPRKETK